MLISRLPFLSALDRLSRIAPSRHRSSIFAHVLLEANGDTVRLTATDGRTWVTVSLPCQAGDLTAALLIDDVRRFVEPADLDLVEDSIELQSIEDDQVLIAREGAFTTQPSVPATAFPRPRAPRRRRPEGIAALSFGKEPHV